MKWPNNVLFAAKKVYQTVGNWQSVAEIIAEDFNINTDDFVDFAGALRKAVNRQNEIALLLDTLPDPTPKRFAEVMELPNENALLIGDLHIDYYDRDFLKQALQTAERYNCTGIIIGGDFFNGGELSTHPKNEQVTAFQDEMRMAGKVLSVLGNLPWCKWIGIVSGNHDERYSKKLNAYATMESLVYGALAGTSITAKLYITDRDYAYYGADWGIGHLSQWHKEGGKLALDQAKRHNKKVFAVWHDHIQGVCGDSERLGISVGSMLLEDSQFYKERRLSKFAPFQNGFLIRAENRPILFNKQGIHTMCGGN